MSDRPLITHIYTADPSAHVFEDRLFIYPSHDRETDLPENDLGDQYDMVDYHIFSTDAIGGRVVDHGLAFTLDDVPWASELDLERLELRIVDKIDDDYVSLRFPLGKFAQRLAELRARAKQQDGKGAEQTFKLMANTTYGVLGSRHYPTNNVVAANMITATARAVALDGDTVALVYVGIRRMLLHMTVLVNV